MNLETVRHLLLYCTLLNGAFIGVWGLLLLLGREWTHRLISRAFPIPAEQLDAINFAGILFYKIGWLLLNLVPCLVSWLVPLESR
ncbi:MAG: hypothetical protein HY820_27055 [Acidobacteria bacterium]|nr:hypothetical protein [Acidobacteriota bacterium]